jgi:hypothetical protein
VPRARDLERERDYVLDVEHGGEASVAVGHVRAAAERGVLEAVKDEHQGGRVDIGFISMLTAAIASSFVAHDVGVEESRESEHQQV